jgi:signal transduction histidine kinase/PAS domain-containing protein
MVPTRNSKTIQKAETDGLAEDKFRKEVRSRFTEVEIDLILELISRIPVAIWAASGGQHNYSVQLWSPGAELLYGFSKGEILGKNYIDTFVNPLERRQAIADHKTLEDNQRPYRNLARDQREDKTTRLMLTQGIALWHPVLQHYLQGEVTVDATDVPGKDRSWLEQVLTPESVRTLLERFIEMTQAAFDSVEKVVEVAGRLIKVFLGESAQCLVFLEREGARLVQVGAGTTTAALEFEPKAVVRWCMSLEQSGLIVDYDGRKPPTRIRGRRFLRFPERLKKVTKPAPFAVGIVRDELKRPRGGTFIYLATGVFSELTEGILTAVCGTVQLALAIEEKIKQTQREGSLAAKERERQATIRLARQYRHAVLKKADLLEFHSGLLLEQSKLLLEEPRRQRISEIAAALSSMSRNLYVTGKSFETNLSEEDFDLGDVLSSVTGAVMADYPDVKVTRDDFPHVQMRGIRPFIEGAFENLLLNAVEAQNYEGEIGVLCGTVTRQGRGRQPEVDVFICDNGPGVPVEVREKIKKGDQISTKGEARGFGLVIARLSFNECGGELQIMANPMPGWSGACFKVRLPVLSRVRKKA